VAGITAEARFELRSTNIVMAGLDPAIHEAKKRPGAIPAFFDYTFVIVREGGRSSTLRPLDSISGGGDYWMPAFAGMTT
jgi:hypothetical protein